MEDALVIWSIIGFLIWMAILQDLIYSGTKTKQRMVIEKAQLALLAAMARKAGVAEKEVEDILYPKKVKGRLF